MGFMIATGAATLGRAWDIYIRDVNVSGSYRRAYLLEGIMRLQDKISARTIGIPRGARAAAADRPLIATAPAAV